MDTQLLLAIINPQNSPRHSAIADANAEASYDFS
jgi:hypothetical protein